MCSYKTYTVWFSRFHLQKYLTWSREEGSFSNWATHMFHVMTSSLLLLPTTGPSCPMLWLYVILQVSLCIYYSRFAVPKREATLSPIQQWISHFLDVQCNLSIPNLAYSEILLNLNKLFGPKVFYHLLHIKLPCVFRILCIPNPNIKSCPLST